MTPDGVWHPPAGGVGQPTKESGNGCLWAALIAVVLVFVLPVMAILAITFLGKTASSKFESIGTSISGAGGSRLSDDSDSKSDFEDELVAQDIDRPLASCIVDYLDDVGFEFRKYGELTETEQRQIANATTACLTDGP